MNHAQFNVAWAQQLLAGLQAGGVRHLVVAPGSRSTPLVLAAVSQSGFERHVQSDERAAAWFALGIGKATGRPAALVTTSGTAVGRGACLQCQPDHRTAADIRRFRAQNLCARRG